MLSLLPRGSTPGSNGRLMNVSADFTELVSNPWQWTIDKREIFQEAGKRKVQESWFSEIGLGDTLERR